MSSLHPLLRGVDTATASSGCDLGRPHYLSATGDQRHHLRLPKGVLAGVVSPGDQNPRCAKSVPRQADTARHGGDRAEIKQPLSWAFADTVALCATP